MRIWISGTSDPKGFDWYLIFYRLTETTIEVVRVLHGSRDLAAALGEA